MSTQIKRLLQGYSQNAIQTIARLCDLAPEIVSKHEIVKALSECLTEPSRVMSVLAQLDSLERLTLEHLLLEGGQAKTDIMKQELLQSGFIAESPSTQYAGSAYRQMPRYFEDVMARLTALGLVFSERRDERADARSTELELSPGPRMVIPDEIQEVLDSRPSWMPQWTPRDISLPTRDTAEAFQRDLFLFWSYVHNHEITLTSRNWIPKRHWSRLSDSFWGKDDSRKARTEVDAGRLYFIHLLMEEMGLLQRRGSDLHVSPGSRSFLNLSSRARTERALRAWLRSSTWNEFSRIPELRLNHSDERCGRLAHVLRSGRQFVVGLLKHLPAHSWIGIDEFIAMARKVNPEFLLARHNNYGYHNPYHVHNSALSWELPIHAEGRGWEYVEARFIANVLREGLHWLGVVELGTQDGRHLGFRIPPMGAQILGIVPPEPGNLPQKRIIVQPNFQIFALDPISDYTLSMLDDFAERISSEHVFEYVLTRDSVYAAQQRGMAVTDVIAFLDQESSTPVPQNVKLTLQEWGRYHERITIYQGVSLCQVHSPAVLDAVLGDRASAALIGQRISPTAAVVLDESSDLQSLRRALQAKGILPTRTGAPPPEAPELHVHEGGRIVFRHRVPDFHLLRRLSPFSQRLDGDLYVTEGAIAAATADGWTAAQILDLLRSLQRDDLPASLVAEIKVWGRHYGNAAIEKVTLVQVKNAEILQELTRDPDIGPLIKPFSSLGAAATVRDEDVAELEELLARKNMGIRRRLFVR